MNLDHATSPLADGRDVVVYPRGASWGFRLPQRHTISVRQDDCLVYLATPDHGSAFRLDRVEEAVGEVRVILGEPTADAHAVGSGSVPPLRAYSFPEIHHELDQLKAELADRGGSRQDASAWAQGAGHGSHTEALRQKIRELRQ